jgi:hypothetical protein
MVFGLKAADENDVLRRRDGLACRERRADDFCRRWRYRRHQHQTADTAIIDAMFAVGLVGRRGRLVAGDNCMTDDDAVWGGRRLGRRAGRSEGRDQARQRNRISRRQRNNAPPQRPPGEILAHGPNLVPADIETTDTLSRRYRDYHYTNPNRRDLFRDPVVTAQRSRATPSAPRPYPSRLASLAPQDDGNGVRRWVPMSTCFGVQTAPITLEAQRAIICGVGLQSMKPVHTEAIHTRVAQSD